MQQQTDEWFAARVGRVTASRVSDIVAKTKSGWSASRANYMAQLIAERLTGEPYETYSSPAMQWGSETEEKAREAYEFITGSNVQQVGFVEHPTIKMSGASPDGLVGDIGLVEIKCPNTATHIKTLLGGNIEKKYRVQMQWQMACTGRKWCDFVSFDPRMPMDMQIDIERVHADGIDELEASVIEFIAELDEKLHRLQSRKAA